MARMRMLVGAAIVLLPGVVLFPVWRLAGLGAAEDDILYYLPSRTFFHESYQSGHWPWINPWTGLGRPFAADPQSAVWYPFTWLFAALPPLTAYPLSLWLHYSIAMWGMYRLLRAPFLSARNAEIATPNSDGSETPDVARATLPPNTAALSRGSAIFGAIAFAFCGFMLAHRAHFAMQHAAAWTPWVLWRIRRYAENGGGTRLFSAAIVAGCQILAGHVQIAALTAVGSLVMLVTAQRSLASMHRATATPLRMGIRWLLTWTAAAGLCSIQLLPILEYLRVCTRPDQPLWLFLDNSLSPTSTIGWVLPMIFGQRVPNETFGQPYWGPSHQVEQFSYVGVLPLLLAALALRTDWKSDPGRRPWIILGCFALLLALGPFTPLAPLLYFVPGSSVFRVPARAMLLFDLGVAALAANAAGCLTGALSRQRAHLLDAAQRWTRRPIVAVVLIMGLPCVAIAACLPVLDEPQRAAVLHALRPTNPAIWIPLVVCLTSVVALRYVAKRLAPVAPICLLATITTIDLAIVGWTIDRPAEVSSPAELLASPERDEWLPIVLNASIDDGAPRRLWTVTDRIGGIPGEYLDPLAKCAANTNVLVHISTLTDYGPLQPRGVITRFGFAPWGETSRADDLLADTSWMRLTNTGWVLQCDPTGSAPSGCELALTTTSGFRLYRNPHVGDEVFFENPAQPGVIRQTIQSPSEFEIVIDTWPARAAGNDIRVIVARCPLPGWRAAVAGEPLAIEPVDGIAMAVRVPAGATVTMSWTYDPPGLVPGAAVSAVSAAVLLVAALVVRTERP